MRPRWIDALPRSLQGQDLLAWGYHLVTWVTLSVVDDAALLALLFC